MRGLFPASGPIAPDDIPRALRLELARRGRRVEALARGGFEDPVVLSRLGLHGLAAEAFDCRPEATRRWAAEAVASYFAVGRGDDARQLARQTRGRTKKKRLALALAGFDKEMAVKAAPGGQVDLRAALGAEVDPVTPEGFLASGDLAPEHWGRLFEARAMTPIASRTGATITLDNATAPSQAVHDGALVSVVMPVWNTAMHVGTAVRSILDQGWRNLELIVVDDDSDDGSADVARQAAAGDERLIVIRQPLRRGPYVARNRALTAARGRWIAFHDADEWAHPDRLRVQVGQMMSRGLVASAGRSVRIDSAGRPRARGVWPLVRFAPSTMMIDRKAVLDRAGLMHEVTSGADNEYWWRMTLLFGPRRVAPLPHLLILGAWRDGSQTVSAQEGYGSGGVNLSRLAYWEGWNRWHLSCRRRLGALKLAANAQPFAVPPDLEVPPARGAI